MISIRQVRTIMGKESDQYSDAELGDVLNVFYGLADLVLEVIRNEVKPIEKRDENGYT